MKSFLKAALVGALVVFGGAVVGCKEPPNPAREHREKGDEFFKKEMYREAAAEYDLSLEAKPDQAKLWEKAAFAHMKSREFTKAANALIRTVDFAEDKKAAEIDITKKVADMYLKAGMVEQAEAFFLKALELDPDDDASLGWLGAMYMELGGARDGKAPANPAALDKAIGYFDKAIGMHPEQPFPYVNKRIVIAKYMNHMQAQADEHRKTAATLPKKERAKYTQVMAEADDYQQKAIAFKKQYDELGEKVKALLAAQKAGTTTPTAAPVTATPAQP